MWWRALRRRPLVDVLLLALSALAVATAVLGPLLVRATQQATVADTVATAGDGTALTVYSRADARSGLGPLETATAAALVPVATGASASLWGPLQQWTETTSNVAWQAAGTDSSEQVYSRLRVSGGCADLVVTSGRCPGKKGEALVSTVDADQHQVMVGDDLDTLVGGLVNQSSDLVVVGTYDPSRVAAPLTRPGTVKEATAPATGDPLIVVSDQLADLTISTQVSARLALRHTVTLADVPLLQHAVAELTTSVGGSDSGLVVDTDLPGVLERISTQSRAAVVLVAVIEAQALGIALFAVVVVLSRVARARSAEWGAGRLLGVPHVRWLRSVYLEPGIALALGVPLGYAAALGIGYVAVRVGLRAGTPYEVGRWPVLAAAGGAGLLVLLVLVVVSLPNLRRPLAELVAERSEAVGATPLGAAAQSVVVLLAGLTVYVLLAGDVLGGRGPQLGLLAPALFGLALAVIGIRVAVLLVRRRARRPARSLSGLVVARQAARAPSSLAPAVVVTAGVALLVFAAQLVAVSVRNQELKADAVTGAATVLHVTLPAGADLIGAVDRADPDGRSAMAVRERDDPADLSVGRVVAVESDRLAAVAAWSPHWAGVGDVAAALRPPTSAPIELTGSRIDVRLAAVNVTPGGAPLDGPAPSPDPTLSMTLDTGSRWQTVDLGLVATRRRSSAAIPCAQGCRLVAISVASSSGHPYTSSFTITEVGTDITPPQGVPDWLDQQGRWQVRSGTSFAADPPARVQAVPEGNGLTIFAADDQGGAELAVTPTDVLDPLPALLGPQTQDGPDGGASGIVRGTGLDGNLQPLHVAGTAEVLPRALADGALVDLRSAQDLVDPQKDTSRAEVWLAPDAPATVEASLAAAGLVVTGREQLTDTEARLVREPTTRAAKTAQIVALAAALLTLLALVAARVVDAPRRRLDWRSLADAGVEPRQLRNLAGVEVAAPALLAVALGAASGLVAFALSAPRLPLVDLTTPGPPLELGVDWPLALLTVLGCAVAVVVVALTGAVVETRRTASGLPRLWLTPDL